MTTELAHSDRSRLATTTEAGDKVESIAEEKVAVDDGGVEDAARGSDIDIEKGLPRRSSESPKQVPGRGTEHIAPQH